jgi:hypothetical protein
MLWYQCPDRRRTISRLASQVIFEDSTAVAGSFRRAGSGWDAQPDASCDHATYLPKLEEHVRFWLYLLMLNLLLFPLLGLAAYLLVKDVPGPAASISRAAIAIFVPL